MLGAVIDNRRCGQQGVTVLERLLALILPHRHVPPPPPPPSAVRTTPLAEKRQIDNRLRGAEAHLAELTSIAGLDELRSRAQETDRRAE